MKGFSGVACMLHSFREELNSRLAQQVALFAVILFQGKGELVCFAGMDNTSQMFIIPQVGEVACPGGVGREEQAYGLRLLGSSRESDLPLGTFSQLVLLLPLQEFLLIFFLFFLSLFS